MQVKSIAECSNGSILQYFRPSLSYHLTVRFLFCLFLSDCFTQVLLYHTFLTTLVSNEVQFCFTNIDKSPVLLQYITFFTLTPNTTTILEGFILSTLSICACVVRKICAPAFWNDVMKCHR